MNFCSCCVNHLSDGFTLIHKGRNGTFMNGALSRCLQITLEKYKCHHISPLAVLFYAIETLFLFQNHQYEREFAFHWFFLLHLFFSPPFSEKHEIFVKFTKVLPLAVYPTLKALAICSSDFQFAPFQCAPFVVLVVTGDNSWEGKNASCKQ